MRLISEDSVPATLPLHHADFGAVLQKLHLVHKLVDQINSPAMLIKNIFPHDRAWEASGIKTFAGIAHHNQNSTTLVASHIASASRCA